MDKNDIRKAFYEEKKPSTKTYLLVLAGLLILVSLFLFVEGYTGVTNDEMPPALPGDTFVNNDESPPPLPAAGEEIPLFPS